MMLRCDCRPPYNFNAARPTFIDAWPRSWSTLAPESELVTIDRNEMNALGRQIAGFQHWFPHTPTTPLVNLARRVDKAVERMSRSCFVRLTSRSPKDSIYAQRKGMRIGNGAQALALIIEGSRRCAADLRMALDHQAAMAIVVRKWIDFSPSAEFRCFMVDRKWVGASQMRETEIGDVFLTIQQARVVASALQAAMHKITATSHIANAAFDYLLQINSPIATARTILLDVNPLLCVTDLAHFSSSGEFDFSLRFNTPEKGGFVSIPLP